MLATFLSAAITGASALVLGQGVLRLCGWRSWSWLSAPVGVSALMLLAVPSLHVPGRTVTCAIVIVIAIAASVAVLIREPSLRPPLAGIAAGVWPLLLTLVPFAAAGRSGTLGVSISNDMSVHLQLADAHIREGLTAVLGPNYPLGPHAAVAVIAGPTGMATDHAFAGFTMALPVLLGWTAQGAVRRAGWFGRSVVAVLVGMPFLVAAYFGQGAFKEILLAQLVLGVVLVLADHGSVRGPLRWVPAGIIVAGTISVYSYTGLLWPVLIFGGWLVGLAITGFARRGHAREHLVAAVRAELPAFAVALVLLAVVLIPQMPRIYRYLKITGGGTGLVETTLGNLLGALPFWEGFGVWDNPDFRLAAHDPLAVGVWVGAILVLVGAAALWWARRGEWMQPVAVGICALIWLYVDRTQSPYVAAKALVIFTPMVMTLVVRPLVERDGRPQALSAWGRIGAPLAAAVLVYAVVGSSWGALRASQVGPRDHLVELRELRSSLHGAGTLFLGNDDFIRYALEGVPVQAPFIGAPNVAVRPEKGWQYGQAFDFDSVTPEVYQSVSYVIATRDAAASVPPSQLRLLRTTRDFALYQRVGQVPRRGLLPEGEASGAILNCRRDPRMRALSRRGGTAAVRGAGITVPGPGLQAGRSATVNLAVPAGSWDIVMAYTSALPIEVSAPGLHPTTMPPNLDRPGPRYPVGRITVTRTGGLPLRLHVVDHPLSSTAAPAIPTSITAVPVGSEHTVPLRQACRRFVDWFIPRGAA